MMVLRRLGIRAGHEDYYNPWNMRSQKLDVDVSWVAAAHLPLKDTVIWHQVREPLATLTSLILPLNEDTPYTEVRNSMLRPTSSDMERLMAGYVDVNLRVEEHAEHRWQVEKMDAMLLMYIAAKLGYRKTERECEDAFSLISTQTNRHNLTGHVLQWDDLPEGGLKQELVDMSRRYGYLT